MRVYKIILQNNCIFCANFGKDKTGDAKMKKYTVITIILVGIILGFFTGIYLYRINKMDTQIKTEKIAETIDDNNTKTEELNHLSVSNSEEKTSPNCIVVLKIYYEVCNHLIETRKNIDEAEVNLTEAELKEKFKEWELQKFTRNRNCVI